jgi:DNA polymerase IIIc chi subunit
VAAPQVDFYVLPGSDGTARLRFACRLVEKAWLLRRRVRVRLEPGELDSFDQMLWTFADRSFVPHRRAGAPDDVPASAPPPVVIGDSLEADAADGDVLVNLAADGLPEHGRWERIAEIVDADAGRRAAGRERFRAWRERGAELKSHDIGSEA